MDVWEFPKLRDADTVAERISSFCAESRASLRENGTAISDHAEGQVPDNIAGEAVVAGGSRPRQTKRGPVKFDKSLSENFTLAIKHPVAFSALLKTLTKRFECYAIVRNPLATLASWNSLEWLNVRNGHAPIGEKLDENLQRDLAAMPDRIDRQLHILEWFYARFRDFLPPDALIKYEDVVSSQGRELGRFFPGAENLKEDLTSKNVNKLYDRALMLELGERLLARSSVVWDFYKRDEVEKLLAEAGAGTRQ